MSCFNSRSREGSDIRRTMTSTRRSSFNSRSREGSDCCVGQHIRGDLRFNSRSREGSDCKNTSHEDITNVSIHAPARGATGLYLPLWRQRRVSIHAPARGATYHLLADVEAHRFNSRSREGSDANNVEVHVQKVFQFTLPRGERLSRQKYN